MATEKAVYDLVRDLQTSSSGDGLLKIAKVVAVNPLGIQIGDAVYSKKDWVMYGVMEAVNVKAKELSFGQASHRGVPYSVSGPFRGSDVKAKEVELEPIYKVGDLLAVAELNGGSCFLLLCRLRRLS